MGNRLTRIYTRTGDDGTTGLGDGSRIPKDAMRVEAMGAVDELNSAIGVLLANDLDDTSRSTLTDIQHSLFDLGDELSMPGTSVISDDRVTILEERLDTMNNGLAPLKEFILPGGSSAAAACHLARAICRRAVSSSLPSASSLRRNSRFSRPNLSAATSRGGAQGNRGAI